MIPQPVTQPGIMAYDRWLAEVDDLITSEIADCYPHEWDENFISLNWLRAVTKRFRQVTVADLDLPFTVTWTAYKANGKVETRYGDIGVVVDFNLSLNGDAATATGVAFLEAKRVGAKGDYPHLEWDQLRREAANIGGHRVLLYDHEDIDGASRNLDTHGFCRHFENAPYGTAHASVAITQHILALQERSRNIGSLGVPLGYQLCARYLRGLDLDYTLDRAAILNNIPGDPRYLIVASVEESSTADITGGTPLPNGYVPISETPLAAQGRDQDSLYAEGVPSPAEGGIVDLYQQFYPAPQCGPCSGTSTAKGQDEEEGLLATA